MNIQIYGKAKCFDTKKAERYFAERRIKYQYIDILKYGISKGEFASVQRAVGGPDKLADKGSKKYAELNMGRLTTPGIIEELLLANTAAIKTPIVRNGRQATVGYCPDVWGAWE